MSNWKPEISTDGGVWLLTERGQWERMPDRKFWTVSVGADHEPGTDGLAVGKRQHGRLFAHLESVRDGLGENLQIALAFHVLPELATHR